jgi:hypothetical protein
MAPGVAFACGHLAAGIGRVSPARIAPIMAGCNTTKHHRRGRNRTPRRVFNKEGRSLSHKNDHSRLKSSCVSSQLSTAPPLDQRAHFDDLHPPFFVGELGKEAVCFYEAGRFRWLGIKNPGAPQHIFL